MANITLTYNPKAGGRVRVTTGVITAAHIRTFHRAGFIFAPGANVGFYSPGATGQTTIIADVTSIHSDTLTLTESTTGYYDDTARRN